MRLFEQLPQPWQARLSEQADQPYWQSLERYLISEYLEHSVFPQRENIFRAFESCEPDSVRVVILGQDPYHDNGQAHGLSFSVPVGMKHPPSLRNIFRELESDIGAGPREFGDLSSWAEQGVLLLNTVLTVRAHEANSHRNQGWEQFTDAVIEELGSDSSPKVFLLWGKPAQSKSELINVPPHEILSAPHPSPLSAYRGFFGSRPFSQANQRLAEWGRKEIDWNAGVE